MKRNMMLIVMVAATVFLSNVSARNVAGAAGEASQGPEKAFVWEDNSKAMFDKTVESSPVFVRPVVRRRLMQAVEKKAKKSGVVTEELLIACIKETTPDPFIEKAMSDIEPLKTKKKNP